MGKNAWKVGMASALAVGTGTVLLAETRKRKMQSVDHMRQTKIPESDYRNTERGSQKKNSKGIYYAKGNYEAFARPEKPVGIEGKTAYLIGSGLGSLAAACFLIRDAQMPGENIHILEAMDITGGSCDGIHDPTRGYVMRGGREMEDHFECLWDLFHSIPSLEIPGASVLDEFYWLNKHDPNYSLCRATKNRGEDAHTDGKFRLSQKGSMEIIKLFFTKNEDLYDKTIEDVFDDEVFKSDFWLYWRTMFAFENWDVKPDLVSFAKGITCGYVPLGGVIVDKKIADYFDDHKLMCGLTYSGHPLACAAGLATLDVYKEEKLVERSKAMGKILGQIEEELKRKHPCVGDVRYKGLFSAIELVKDKETKEPLVEYNKDPENIMGEIIGALKKKGFSTYSHENNIIVAPPLIITETELRDAMAIMDEVLTDVDAMI